MPQTVISWCLEHLRSLEVAMCTGCVLVNARLLAYVSLISVSSSFWASHVRSLLAISMMLTSIGGRKSEALVVVCYSSAYYAIVNACGFNRHVADLLKACFGSAAELRTLLVVMAANASSTPHVTSAASARLSHLYCADNQRLSPYSLKLRLRLLMQLCGVFNSSVTSFEKLNLLRKLLSSGTSCESLGWCLAAPLKHIMVGIAAAQNLKVRYVPWFYNRFGPHAEAFYQIDLEGGVSAVGETRALELSCRRLYASQVTLVYGR
ncbi:MAG: hypothetical protein ACKESB_02485 [Candidatus Hodgkinia cicadicola]